MSKNPESRKLLAQEVKTAEFYHLISISYSFVAILYDSSVGPWKYAVT